MRIISLLLIMVASNVLGANIPVTIKATADNRLAIVLTHGQSHTLVYSDVNSDWRTLEETTIHVSNINLSKCSIDFITMNFEEQRGLAASITGDLTTVNTGDPSFSTYKTSSVGHTLPQSQSVAVLNQIYGTKTATQTTVYSTNAVWGPASNIGFDPAVKWISVYNPYVNNNTYAIHSLPCSKVVKPMLVAHPLPGPAPLPYPRPRPLPLPSVKGDHFSCYMLEKGPNLKPEYIAITDQFGAAKAVLGMPRMICNPSEKIHNGKHFGVKDSKRHLVCYEFVKQSPNKAYDLLISNQFERRKVRSHNRELFCVPSLKSHL